MSTYKPIFICTGIIFGALILAFSITLTTKFLDNAARAKITASNTKTIGIIYKVKNLNRRKYGLISQTISFEYIVNGKKYRGSEKTKLLGRHAGERFEIMYESKDPENFIIDFENPTFLKEDITATTRGRFEYTDAENKNVTFSYIVNEQEYSSAQFLPDRTNINMDGPFIVEYLVSDPWIAIIKKPFEPYDPKDF